MAALTDTTIASTYKQLLKLTSEGVSADASAKYVEDGLGTDTALSLSTTRVGIGTASPSAELNVEGTGMPSIHISRDKSAGAFDANGWGLGVLAFGGQDSDSGEDNDSAYIRASVPTTAQGGGAWSGSSHPTQLGFYTTPTSATSASERMTISASGNVGIGTTSPASLLTVQGDNKAIDVRSADVSNVLIGSAGSSGDGLDRGSVILREGGSNNVLLAGDGTGIFEKTLSSDTQTTPDTVLTLSTKYSSTGADGGAGAGTRLLFKLPDDTANPSVGASIDAVKENADDAVSHTSLVFSTSQDDETLDEAMRITSGGSLGLGSGTGTSTKLHVDDNSSSTPLFRMQNSNGNYWDYGFSDATTLKIAFNASTKVTFLSSGKVGIGTDSPGELFTVAGGAGTAIQVESSAGNDAGFRAKTSDTEYRLGSNVGGRGSDTFSIDETTTERVRIAANGDFYTNDGTVHSLSDIRCKKDIADLEDGLSIINQLKPRTFKYNGRTVREDDTITRYGFIADEVLEVASNYVSIGKELLDGEMVDDFKSLSTIKMIPMMVNAIKELSAKVEELKTELQDTKAELQDTKDYVDHKQDYNSLAGRINSCEARIGHLEKK
tara:strand:- start:1618 stop:3438 length:1821 start_codon:yes stop_codon:yes gene_type:complete